MQHFLLNTLTTYCFTVDIIVINLLTSLNTVKNITLTPHQKVCVSAQELEALFEDLLVMSV